MVFVVALSKVAFKEGGDYTWIDVVEKDYFHPIGRGWPEEPPNYIAFRYDGKLQSVHYIESYEVVTTPCSINENWLEADYEQYARPGNEAIGNSEKRSYLEQPSLVHHRYTAFGFLHNHP